MMSVVFRSGRNLQKYVTTTTNIVCTGIPLDGDALGPVCAFRLEPKNQEFLLPYRKEQSQGPKECEE